MTKTKIQRALAIATITALSLTQFGTAVAATVIGTATVSGQSSFDTDVIWNDVFPGTAQQVLYLESLLPLISHLH